MLRLSEINVMNKSDFVEKVGWVCENNNWISEKAWEKRPFPSVEALYKVMDEIVQQSPKQSQFDIICAHPELGTGQNMNPISIQEQTQAGIKHLSADEYEQFKELNQKYIYRFGFPFILAVHAHNKNSILTALRNRLNNSFKFEFETALKEISKITYFRLKDSIVNDRRE